MKKEAIIFRLLGLFSAGTGSYWFWKADFTLNTVWGIPLPLQFIFIVGGLFILLIPAPFLSVIGVLLPDGLRQRVENFSNTNLRRRRDSQIVFKPGDEGQILADKLNKAVLYSKRRFYIGVAFALFALPILILYLNKVNERTKETLIGHSDDLVQVLQTTRLGFSSADRFRSVLRETSDVKNTIDRSSSGRIYHILHQLYGEDVTSEEIFQSKISAIYDGEIKARLAANDFDFKKTRPPLTDTDSKNAREALYILLAVICNLKGRNGLLLEPYLYGRIALNEVAIKPTVYYHVSGWNYGGLFKSTRKHNIDQNTKLTKAAFPNGFSTKWSLAAKALVEYKEYVKLDSSQLALVRSLNNVVDIHLPIIYFLRIRDERFQPETDEEIEILKIKTENPDLLFKRLRDDLDKTKTFLSDAVIDTTAAQLYSLEGEVNSNEKTLHSKSEQWCYAQRQRALERISHAIKPQSSASRETFSYENRETSFLTWLWEDPETRKRLEDMIR